MSSNSCKVALGFFLSLKSYVEFLRSLWFVQPILYSYLFFFSGSENCTTTIKNSAKFHTMPSTRATTYFSPFDVNYFHSSEVPRRQIVKSDEWKLFCKCFFLRFRTLFQSRVSWAILTIEIKVLSCQNLLLSTFVLQIKFAAVVYSNLF